MENINFQEVNDSIEISIDNQENQTFSLKTSRIRTYNFEYYIVVLDSVQSIIEKKEKQAWYDLMKVISHEMMNTLTPINSLVGNLEYYVNQPELDEEERADFAESLKTIQKKTVHMLEFVDNYRQLTNFPSPKKSIVNLSIVVESCVEMMQNLAKEKSTFLNFEAPNVPMEIAIDVPLIERVLINLITNSLYAVESNEGERKIYLSISKSQNRILVLVKDNGYGIEKEIRDKIFIPFFTTRQTGAGIGLSLSRNIMEAHDGHLTFTSKPGETVFQMSFNKI